MNKLVKPLIFAGLMALSVTASAGMETVFTVKGYPYKDLVQRSDRVKLIYTEDESGVECHVEVDINSQTLKSDRQQATQDHFDAQPLASCLTRDHAIQFLAHTFKG